MWEWKKKGYVYVMGMLHLFLKKNVTKIRKHLPYIFLDKFNHLCIITF